MDTHTLASIVESLLFVSGDPISVARLAGVVEVSEEDIEKAIVALTESYEQNRRGLFLLRKEGDVLLTSHPDHASFVERLVRSEREGNLSRSAIETLSIVAYRGPVGRADIEAIRGVNSTMTLRGLLLRGLVERRGNPDDARGYLYSPSFSFLETLGLSDRSELPDYESLSKDERLSILASEENSAYVETKSV
jgi:segregation and condensation protein B